MTGCEVCGRAYVAGCPHERQERPLPAVQAVSPTSRPHGGLSDGALQALLHEVVLELERRGYVCNYGVGGPVR